MERRGFVIAAVSSGSGKTTVTNGLLRAFRNRGLHVAPFKVGPDYIDTHYHKIASGSDSINLDLFMSSEEHVRRLFGKYSPDSDVCIVEGVMGLFDGYDRKLGSASHIAKLLNLPVILLVNAASSAYSLAALMRGFIDFDRDVRIAGVIFNNVASDNHQRLLQAAAEDAGVKCFGFIKRNEKLKVSSRHLGLSLGDDEIIEEFISNAALAVEDGLDLDSLLQSVGIEECRIEEDGDSNVDSKAEESVADNLREEDEGVIAVAHDEAFNFIYPENLTAMKSARMFGGKKMRLVEFSPLHDTSLPEADFIYFPGGYPELYKEQLSSNGSMIESVKKFAEIGGRILAECGGLLYLGEDIDGFRMCGILPISATMHNAKLRLGYRQVMVGDLQLRGHEFHYSSVKENKPLDSIAVQQNVKGEKVDTPLYRYKNVIAGYPHLYWGEKDLSELWE